MGRRWLLQVLAGVTMAVGLTAAPAVAQVAPIDATSVAVGDTVSADIPSVGAVRIAPSPEARSVTVEAEPAVDVEAADTTVPDLTAEVSPTGPSVEVSGPTRVGGQDLPLETLTEPVEDAVGSTPVAPEPGPLAPPFIGAPSSRPAADGGVAPAPAASGSTETTSSSRSALPRGLGRGAVAPNAGVEAPSVFDDILAPQIADAAARPEVAPDVLALPIVDTIPDVPALLRLLAGVMVLGAGLTWRMVRDSIA